MPPLFLRSDTMLLICYPKCTTCQRAQKYLDDNNIKYEYRHIKDNNPTKEELKLWHKLSNLPLKKLFNTSGLLYKELDLKNKLDHMSDEEKYDLLASNGMLVKRPILITNTKVLFGFKEAEWKDLNE